MDDPVLDSLRAALATTPDNAELRIALGKLLLERHQAAEAEAVVRDGLRVRESIALTRLLAECFYAQGRYGEALVASEQATAADGTVATDWLLTARCHFQQEDYPRAREAYARAKQLDAAVEDPRLDSLGIPQPTPERDDDDPRERAAVGGDPTAEYVPLKERAKIGFADVGGMEAVKEEIRMKVLHPLQHQDMFAAYGKKIGGGILMYGPPGCGKTMLARATAGEVDVPFYSISISDVMGPYVGQSEKNLSDIFAEARRNAPAVLFFDEVDALAASRRDLQQSAGRHAINQFLLELDGDKHDNEGVLVVGATNAPWYLDPAFRRPGRFDRIIFVPPPDEPARAAILTTILEKIPAAEVDVTAIAKKARDFSGADLKNVVDHAVEAILGNAIRSGRPEPVATRDLLRALKKSRPSTKEWFVQARNHAVYANDGGLYDDVLVWMGIKK